MKKARLVIAMVIVAMMTSIFSIASAETTVAVKATEGTVGDEVTVTFTLPANSGVYALDMDVTFNAEELEYVSAKLGDKVGMGSVKTNVGLVAGETDGVAENDILTVVFKVLKDGATVTGTIVEATDEEANILDAGAVKVASTTIVAPTTAAPTTAEPTTAPTTAPATAVPTTGGEPTTAAPSPSAPSTTEAPATTVVDTATDVVETQAQVDDNPNTGVVVCTAAVVALAASGVVLVKSKRK